MQIDAQHARTQMLNQHINLYPVAIYSFLACMAYLGSDKPGNVGAVYFVATCVLAGLAAASFWNWVVDTWITVYTAKRIADTHTKEILLAERLAGLTPEQLDLFRQLSRASMDETDMNTIVIDGVPVPDDFIREIVAGSRGANLLPERTYSDGSKERLWYRTLVKYWDSHGIIVKASGNQTAQVTDWHKALELVQEG